MKLVRVNGQIQCLDVFEVLNVVIDCTQFVTNLNVFAVKGSVYDEVVDVRVTQAVEIKLNGFVEPQVSLKSVCECVKVE